MGLLLIMSGLKAVTSGVNEDVGAIGKAIIGTRVLAPVDAGPFKLPSFSFCQLNLLIIIIILYCYII